MGFRAFYVDHSFLPSGDSRVLRCSEFDVLIVHVAYPYQAMKRLLADLNSPVALMAIDEVDPFASPGPMRYAKRTSSLPDLMRLRKDLEPRSLMCTAILPSADFGKQMRRDYALPASAHIIVDRGIPKNLSIDAITVRRNHDKYPTLLTLLEKHPGLTVIVTGTDAVASRTAAKLQADGFDAKAIVFDRPAGRSESVDPELFFSPNPILCVERQNLKHLYHQNVRHVIWLCLAISPAQFRTCNDIAGRDGVPSRCTVLLSEQEIFSKHNAILAATPSASQVRRFITNLFNGNEQLKAGSTFLVEVSRLRLISDWPSDNLALIEFLAGEKMLAPLENLQFPIAFGPRLAPAYERAPHPLEVNVLQALEEITGSHLEEKHGTYGEKLIQAFEESADVRLDKQFGSVRDHFDALLASGRLRRHPHRHRWTFHAFRLLRDAKLSQRELDNLVQKFVAKLHLAQTARIALRHQYLDLFTTKRCILASLAKAVDVDMPPGWKNCGRCLFCVTHKPAVLAPLSQTEMRVDPQRLDAIIRSVPARYATDPRVLARIGLGVRSSQVVSFGWDRGSYIFGSMQKYSFEVCILHQSASALPITMLCHDR